MDKITLRSIRKRVIDDKKNITYSSNLHTHRSSLNKKAVLMTITALLISVLFFLIFSKDNILPAYYTNQPVNARVKSMDTYVKTLPTLMGDSLEIATYNALNSLYLSYEKSGTFAASNNTFFNELENCIECGRTACPSSGSVCNLMNGTDLLSTENNVTDLAYVNLNLNTTFQLYDLEVTQSYPYDVDVRMEIGYTVVDYTLGISWIRRENISRIVSIIGLNDPLIGINTGGAMKKRIVRSTICEFNESCWDLNRTKAFYNQQSFAYSVNGTSFLSRYWNDTASSECCGLESFMRVIDYRNVSFLDHYYFSNSHTCAGAPRDILLSYSIIDSEFKLDAETAGRYGITDNGTMICRP